MIKIILSSGSFHLIESIANLNNYTSSVATKNALQAAYDRGDWEPYTPPVLPPEPLPPDWQAFRLALLKSKTFRTWSEILPNSWREDLKIAAAVENPAALQDVYNQCYLLSPPLAATAAGWQQIATTNNIPVTF